MPFKVDRWLCHLDSCHLPIRHVNHPCVSVCVSLCVCVCVRANVCVWYTIKYPKHPESSRCDKASLAPHSDAPHIVGTRLLWIVLAGALCKLSTVIRALPSFSSSSLSLLSPAGHNMTPLIDLECSIVRTIIPSLQRGPLGLTSYTVVSIMVRLHARLSGPSLYLLYVCVCLNVLPVQRWKDGC